MSRDDPTLVADGNEDGMTHSGRSPLSITLILPAYNEVRRIAHTIQEAKTYFVRRQLPHEIIVSAEGDDGTRELVAQMAATDPTLKVIGSVERRGKGYGIRHAVAVATGEIVGFADADDKTPIEEFDKVRPLLSAGYEVVIGSRRLSGAHIERAQPLYRRLGARGFTVFMRTVVGLKDITDVQCGFKFFQRHAARDIFRRQRIDGYMFDAEVLYLAQQTGYRIAQVPVRWRYDGDSRFNLLRGTVRNILDIARIRFSTRGQLGSLATGGRDEPTGNEEDSNRT